jgi:uncharacterized membrane protein YkoI
MKGLLASIFLSVCLQYAATSVAADQSWQRLMDGRSETYDGRVMSMDQAADMVQSRFNARVVRADEQERDGQVVYRFKLLSNDGRVFVVRVDARTGRIF